MTFMNVRKRESNVRVDDDSTTQGTVLNKTSDGVSRPHHLGVVGAADPARDEFKGLPLHRPHAPDQGLLGHHLPCRTTHQTLNSTAYITDRETDSQTNKLRQTESY